MTDRLAWGILGTGRIAGIFANGVAGSRTGRLVAVGSRSAASARKFAAEHGKPRAHGSYEALLADPAVEAVYISTPHPYHAEWTMKAAQAGKHILCEKPLTLNARTARRVIDEARKRDVFLMEAFMYRSHPQTERVLQLVREGAIGQLRYIQATFSFGSEFNPKSRLYNPELGGGGILDVGCYCVSMARRLAGVANDTELAEPEDFCATGYVGKSGVDEWAMAGARFPGNIVAALACGIAVAQDNTLRIYGSHGRMEVPSPWIPAAEGGTTRIHLHRHGQLPQRISIRSKLGLYALEADTVAANIENRQSPTVPWEDTLGNMAVLDRWRAALGVKYPGE